MTYDEFLAAVIKNFDAVVEQTKPTTEKIASFIKRSKEMYGNLSEEEVIQDVTMEWLEDAVSKVEKELDKIWQEEE